jgi:hypothetical protein
VTGADEGYDTTPLHCAACDASYPAFLFTGDGDHWLYVNGPTTVQRRQEHASGHAVVIDVSLPFTPMLCSAYLGLTERPPLWEPPSTDADRSTP